MQNIIPKIKRVYFEAFGDLEKENDFLKTLAFSLVILLLVSLVFMFFIGRKTPIVIRMDEVSSHVITDLNTNNEPTEVEMVSFSKRFVTRYTAFNSYTISRDLSEAFNQMSGALQKRAEKELIHSGLIEQLKEAGIDTEIEFKEEHVDRNSKEAAVVSLVAVRKVSRYESRAVDQQLFRCDLVLKKLQRNKQNPEGLLVEEYRETILNEVKERK